MEVCCGGMRLLGTAALIFTVSLFAFGAHAQEGKYKLPIKTGAWLVKTSHEHEGKRSPPTNSADLPLDFHDKQFAQGNVHEDGGRIIQCRTPEQVDYSFAIRKAAENGCTTTVKEFTAQKVVSTTTCPKIKATTEGTIVIQNSENYMVSTDTHLEHDGRIVNSKMMMASTWLGSDCKAILEERYAVVRERVQRKNAQDASERVAREQQESQEEQPSSNDAAVLMQGLLQGLQQYADAKKLRKEFQSQRLTQHQPMSVAPRITQPTDRIVIAERDQSGSGNANSGSNAVYGDQARAGEPGRQTDLGHRADLAATQCPRIVQPAPGSVIRVYKVRNSCAFPIKFAYCYGGQVSAGSSCRPQAGTNPSAPIYNAYTGSAQPGETVDLFGAGFPQGTRVYLATCRVVHGSLYPIPQITNYNAGSSSIDFSCTGFLNN